MRRIALCSLLAVLVGCGPSEQAETPGAAPEAGPAFEIATVDAAELREEIAGLNADLVILNVWATWCGPCRMEFPEFVRYGRDQQGNDIAVRFLSVDDPGARPQMEAFLRDHDVRGRTYLTGAGTEIVADLAGPDRWRYGIPATFIFGRDGQILDFWEGAVTYDFLQAKVRQALAAPDDQTAALL